jgi:hypothetical protein
MLINVRYFAFLTSTLSINALLDNIVRWLVQCLVVDSIMYEVSVTALFIICYLYFVKWINHYYKTYSFVTIFIDYSVLYIPTVSYMAWPCLRAELKVYRTLIDFVCHWMQEI